MIISFALANFRSIKDQQTLSLEAGPGKSKPDNYVEVESRGGPIRLLRSAIIFGPNASGKSNLLKGIHALQSLVKHSAELKVGDPMPHYEPYRLNASSVNSPIEFEVEFLLEKIRYRYEFSYSQTEICGEKMTYFPEGKTSLLFERNKQEAGVDDIRLGGSVNNKPKNRQVFSNQLFLSRFGQIEPHSLFTQLYKFFQEMSIWNAADSIGMHLLKQKVIQTLSHYAPESQDWLRLNQLIRSADTGIQEMYIKEAKEHEFQLPDFLPQEVKDTFIQENRIKTFSRHPRFEGEQVVGYEEFELTEESEGTQVLFALGGRMLQTLKTGGILFFDEFDNSLHPTLAKFLIRLFLSSVSNPHNAQLIVASHEVGLISKEMFRKDQIWFTQKSKQGETELYSADDFEGIRDNSAFDRLYLSGSFQAIPHLKTADFLYESPTS